MSASDFADVELEWPDLESTIMNESPAKQAACNLPADSVSSVRSGACVRNRAQLLADSRLNRSTITPPEGFRDRHALCNSNNWKSQP